MSALNSLEHATIPENDEALRAEVRSFLSKALANVPVQLKARSVNGYNAAFSRSLAEHGWIGITLPVQYGGGGRSAFARYVVAEELLNAGAPVLAHWAADRQSGPLIFRYGTEEQKRFYLPRICRGEIFFCIGMSEPQAGSDLAAVRTRATANASGYLLKGQKIWTTNAHRSHYMIALVRTSGESGDRRAGLSQVIVDLSAPGVRVTPIQDLTGDAHFCEVFFDDVQLPRDALIGGEGEGWHQVTAELALERSGPERLFSSVVLYDEWLGHLGRAGVADPSSVRIAGKIFCELAPLRAMSVAIQEKLVRGESPAVEAALVKDLGTGVEQAIPALISDELFGAEVVSIPTELRDTLGYVAKAAPSFSLRGGTRDVLRGMIARELGLR